MVVEVDRISYQEEESGFVVAAAAVDRIESGFAAGAVVVVDYQISYQFEESDFGVDRTDYQEEELIDFVVEVGQTSCWRGLRFVDLVAVGCSGRKYQRYSAAAVVGSGFDLMVVH